MTLRGLRAMVRHVSLSCLPPESRRLVADGLVADGLVAPALYGKVEASAAPPEIQRWCQATRNAYVSIR